MEGVFGWFEIELMSKLSIMPSSVAKLFDHFGPSSLGVKMRGLEQEGE